MNIPDTKSVLPMAYPPSHLYFTDTWFSGTACAVRWSCNGRDRGVLVLRGPPDSVAKAKELITQILAEDAAARGAARGKRGGQEEGRSFFACFFFFGGGGFIRVFFKTGLVRSVR